MCGHYNPKILSPYCWISIKGVLSNLLNHIDKNGKNSVEKKTRFFVDLHPCGATRFFAISKSFFDNGNLLTMFQNIFSPIANKLECFGQWNIFSAYCDIRSSDIWVWSYLQILDLIKKNFSGANTTAYLLGLSVLKKGICYNIVIRDLNDVCNLPIFVIS
jgi:hypothetical protein